ncbi:non-ribosomal peptide synthetase [Streptomyces albus]|uniref:non-ribosomal peptide synthetase n=1 Tax=Streptomyces albus TaxID=1888 RepID=UPI00340EA589
MTGTTDMTVPRQVADLAARRPHGVAIECGAEEITYGQLWERSGRLAARMCAHPAHHAGGLAGVLLPRDVQAIVAQLAAWRAGCAYLPLDPDLPDGRLHALVQDAQPWVTLAPPQSAQRLPRGSTVLSPGPGHAPGEGAATDGHEPAQAAYVVYTSGSTGTPKGVEVAHGSLANLVSWHRRTYGTTAGVRVAAFAGPGFDASVWEVWATLASGATLVLPQGLMAADVPGIRDFLDEHRIDQCFLSTPLAEQLLMLPQYPATLKLLTTGGDRLRVVPPRDFPAAVHNHYGPTEATVVTTAGGDLRGHDGRDLPPIGRPITGAEVRLVDEAGRELTRPGDSGELLIGGAVVATGYRNDPALTKERFESGPDGSVWYRSGDICRWNARGELDYVGRRDTQVNVRGVRIELAEVEQALLRVAGVDQAAVVVRDDPHGGTLVAYTSGTAEEAHIGAALRHSLPAAMRPSAVHRLGLLPLNSNGKIDRAALASRAREAAPSAPPHASGGGTSGQPPATADSVGRIWAGLLGRTPAAGDNFFEIGGHSLLAARVTGQVRELLGVQIGLDEIFGHPVLSDYARRVDELARAAEG